MAISPIGTEQLELAQASYRRCQQAPEFFRAFYDHFIASDPSLPAYFANTRFDKQEKLLQHGISLLFIYAKRPNPNLLARLADRHGPSDLNIPSQLYPVFVASLLATVRRFDPQYDEQTGEAWLAAMSPGIAMIRGSGV
jgi:hemoglobin-like flavoprotein